MLNAPISVADLGDSPPRPAAHRRIAAPSLPGGANAAGSPGIIGGTPGMQQLLHRLAQVAPTATPVLISGEPGTGKHLLAHAIHQLSRRSGPFLTLNATALPAPDLMLHLYGQERLGRDDGVDISAGLLERAQGGTLLIEDVAALDAGGQRCLRQLLAEPTYSRRGSAELRRADVRIIVLTSRPLLELVRQGGFCDALFHCLTPGWLAIPPLRQRRDDIPRLAAAFLAADQPLPSRSLPELPAATLLRLLGHSWPGNVRELREVLRQVAQPRGQAQSASRAPIGPALIAQLLAPTRPPREARFPLGTPLATVQREMILMTLAAVDGNKKDAAALLGVSRGALYSRLRTYSAQARAQWRAAQQRPPQLPPDFPPAPSEAAPARRKSDSPGGAPAVRSGRASGTRPRPADPIDDQADDQAAARCPLPAPTAPRPARGRRR